MYISPTEVEGLEKCYTENLRMLRVDYKVLLDSQPAIKRAAAEPRGLITQRDEDGVMRTRDVILFDSAVQLLEYLRSSQG